VRAFKTISEYSVSGEFDVPRNTYAKYGSLVPYFPPHCSQQEHSCYNIQYNYSNSNKIINDDGRLIKPIYCSKPPYEHEIIYPAIFRNLATRSRKGSPALPYAGKVKQCFERATS
jgi:hypothetical protein